MIKNIIISIVAFLLTLFPDSGNLLITYQQLMFPGEMQVAEDIIDAIVDGDVKAIIDMYSEVAKSTGEVTTESVENLLDSFEGKLLYGDFQAYDSSDYINNGKGERSCNLRIYFVTTEKKYEVYASWHIVDTENSDEVGLGQITVYPYTTDLSQLHIISQVPLKESLNEVRKDRL